MRYFRHTHFWMLVPFIIVIAGFAPSYWFKFFDASFRHHLHGLSATLWFLLLMVQPYLIQKNKINLHRQLGKVGLILAGAVISSALLTIPYMVSKAADGPERIILLIVYWDCWVSLAFLFCVVMALQTTKTPKKHGRWMIVTAFLPLMPACARLIMNTLGPTFLGMPTNYFGVYFVILIFSILIFRDYIKEKTIYASYALVLCSFLILYLTDNLMSNSTWWKEIVYAIFKS